MEEKNSGNWSVKVSSKAFHHFERLDKPTRERVKESLGALCKYYHPGAHPDVIPLNAPFKGMYRLRLGGYRIIFDVLWEQRIIAVVNIAPRGDAYE